jgi:hypothetical protein
MRDATHCRNVSRCRHLVRPVADVARGLVEAGRSASVELVGSAPNVEMMAQRIRASLRARTLRLLEELEGSCFACALNRWPVLTEAPAAGAMPP